MKGYITNNFRKESLQCTYQIFTQTSAPVYADKPEPPTSLEVTSLGSQFVELSWKMDYSGNVPINKYVIQYKEAPGIKFMISGIEIIGYYRALAECW